MPRAKTLTNADALEILAEKLSMGADAPNIFGYSPHAKQFIFHTSVHKKKLYIGGNRSGKTVGGVVEDIWWLTGTHPYRQLPKGPIRGRVVTVSFTEGVEMIMIPLFKQWLPTSFLKNGSWDDSYDKQLRTLTLTNGSSVEFMSYDQDLEKFAGTSRHFIHFDEEPPKDVFNECKARLVDTDGDYWITMTPVEGMTWVFDDIYEPGILNEKGILVVEVSMTDNPYLNAEAIKNFLDDLDDDERAAREHGQFVQLGGLVFKHFKHEVHVTPDWLPPPNWMVVNSLDHGFTNPTAWLWHAVGPEGEVVTFHEHYLSGATIDVHANAVQTYNRDVLKREPDYYIGDPAIRQSNGVSGTSIYTEYIWFGIPIVLGNNDVKAGINRMGRYLKLRPTAVADQLKPQWVITRNCVNTIREIKRYRWATYASKKIASQHNLKDEPQKKDDHAMDSARYFFMSRPDLIAEQPTAESRHANIAGAITVTSAVVRAEPNHAPQNNGDYITESGMSDSDTQWTTDELGGAW